MKTNNANKAVAQGAAEWQENQLRQQKEKENQTRLEKALGSLERTHRTRGSVSDGYNMFPTIDEYFPTEEELICIMEHGSHEDIMRMIAIYAKADHISPDSSPYSIRECAPHPYPLPSQIGTMIAKRSNFSEINAFTNIQGFDADGQDILLAQGNHSALLWYLKRHGFLLEQQRKLIARGDTDEIRTHIKHHGLATELLDELLSELAAGKTDNFYKFIALHELPVSHQKKLIEIAKEPEFMAYINRYGFWAQVLPDLVARRSETELTAYINQHRYLGEGVYELAQRGSRALNMLYAEQLVRERSTFINALTKVKPLDYETLAKLYAGISQKGNLSTKDEEAVKLFKDGSHQDVMAFLKQEKPDLHMYAEAALFFRNKPAEYELYLDIKHYHELKNRIEKS